MSASRSSVLGGARPLTSLAVPDAPLWCPHPSLPRALPPPVPVALRGPRSPQRDRVVMPARARSKVTLVESRLIPVNAILALIARDGGWFEDLADQGFRLHALELDVQSTPGVVRADIVVYRRDPDLILLIEGKSGRNVEERQARNYDAAEVAGIRARADLPNELVGRTSVAVSPLYVCLQEHREDIVGSLAALELDAPVLSVSSGAVFLDGPVPAGLERFARDDARLGLPPVRIRLDRESPLEEFMAVLIQRIVAAAVRCETHLELDEVARGIFQAHWVHLSVQARRDLVALLRRAATQLGRGDLSGFIRVEGSSSVPDRVAIVDSPASADPRGAPQRWQALMRRAARDLGREGPSIVQRQPQLSIDDLAIDVEAMEDLDQDSTEETTEGDTEEDA